MRRAGALACLTVLALAGCASIGRGAIPGAEAPALAPALASLRQASPASLREAARVLASVQPAQAKAAREMAGLGRELYSSLYPELTENPFPAEARTTVYGSLFSALRARSVQIPSGSETDFFRLTIPALILSDQRVSVTAAALGSLEAGLKRADTQSHEASVLPPYLLGLAGERRAASGGTAGSSGSTEGTVLLFQESVKRDSSFYPGQRKAAEILLAQKKTSDAIPLLEGLSAALPQDVSVAKQLARAALDGGKPEDALDATGRGMLAAPDDTDMLILRAQAFDATGDWYQALRVLEAGLKRTPDAKEAILLRARIMAEEAGNVEEAIHALDSAVARFPKDASFLELKGSILLDTGRGDEGVNALKQALELQPDRVSTLRILLQDAMNTKRLLQANEYLAKILAVSETGEDITLAYRVASSLGDYAQAAAYARKLVEKGYGSAPRLLLARALHAEGNDAEARTQIEAGLMETQSAGERSMYRTLLAAMERASNADAAMKDLRSALLDDPNNIEALIAIADLLASLGQYHGAVGYLKHAAELSPEDAGLMVKIADYEKLAENEK